MMEKIHKKRLADSATLIMGQSPPSSSYNERAEGYAFLQGKADFGVMFPKARIYCTEPKKLSESNDLLMSVRAPVGEINISDGVYCIGRGLAAIRCNEEYLNYKYLYHYLGSVKEQISDLGTGSTFKAINKGILADISFPLPPLSEQKRIVAILDKAQQLIDLRRQQLAKLDELIQSIFYDMFGDPVTNPKGWEVKKLEQCSKINPKKSEIKDSRNMEVSFVPMSNVSEKGELLLIEVRKISDVYKSFTYFANEDVLFAKITPCMENGKGCIAKGLKNGIGFGSTEFHVIRPNQDTLNSDFVYQITMTKHFRLSAEKKMTGSAGQRRVPSGFLSSYEIILPPISLQNKFAAKVEKIEEQKKVMQQLLAKLEENFKALQQRAFRGHL
jgi:type I restriction enzyme S subunit